MDSSIYLFIYFWLCWVSVAVHRPSLVSASRGYSHCGARASHCSGLVALQHVGSSWTRARTRVPCIGRRILNHCATREVPPLFLIWVLTNKLRPVDEVGFLALADERKVIKGMADICGKWKELINGWFSLKSLYYVGTQNIATWNNCRYIALWQPFKGGLLWHYPHLCFTLIACSFNPKSI